MLIELISSTTLKITLSELDMLDYNIDYDSLDKSNPKTKHLLMELIDIIKEEEDIDLCSEKLYIEAFPQNDGGCLLYISVISDKLKYSTHEPYFLICEIKNVFYLQTIVSLLISNNDNLITESRLYYLNDIYRLVLEVDSKLYQKVIIILNEFMISFSTDKTISAYTQEHFNCLINKDALLVLSELLSL